MATTTTRGPSLVVAGIQARHAAQIVEAVLADVQQIVRAHAGSTAAEIVQRDQAVAPLMASVQLLGAAVAAIRALVELQPVAMCALTKAEQAAECEGKA